METSGQCFRIVNNIFVSNYFLLFIYCAFLMHDWCLWKNERIKVFITFDSLSLRILNNIALEKLKGIGVTCCSIEKKNWILVTHVLYVRRKSNVKWHIAFMFEKKNWILMKHFLYVWIKLNFNDTLPLCLKKTEC